MKKIVVFVKKIIEKLFKIKILVFKQSFVKQINLKTAVKSEFGFWYSGNVLNTEDIAYGILKNGLVEKQGTELVVNILKKQLEQKQNLNFYDIGANTGYYGVLAAFFGKGKIKTFSFEPVKEHVEALQQTVFMNRLENLLTIFSFALGEKKSVMEMNLAGSGSTLKQEFLGHDKSPKIQIPVNKLDEIFELEKLPKPDFIKIDVEGAELQVLKGAKSVIEKSFPVIWYESAFSIKARNFNNSEFFEVQKFLESLNYKIYSSEEPGMPILTKDFSKDGVFMFLALPKGFRI